MSGLIGLLVSLLVLAIILYVVNLVIGMLTLPAQVKQIALLIVGLIGLLIVLSQFFGHAGLGHTGYGF